MPYIPYLSLTENDCFRKAVAFHVDVHPRRVKFIKPDSNDFWEEWARYINQRFNRRLTFWRGIEYYYSDNIPCKGTLTELISQNRPWIAIVPGGTIGGEELTHAINLSGKKFVHDDVFNPRHRRSRFPKKIFFGLTLEE